jgi:hypothetical protein
LATDCGPINKVFVPSGSTIETRTPVILEKEIVAPNGSKRLPYKSMLSPVLAARVLNDLCQTLDCAAPVPVVKSKFIAGKEYDPLEIGSETTETRSSFVSVPLTVNAKVAVKAIS